MQSLINKFRNTKLVIKFIFIFILLGLGFSFMGFAYYKTIQSEQQSLQKAAKLKHFSNLVDETQLNILEANRNVKDFEIAQDEEDLNSFNEKIDEIDNHLAEIKKMMRSDKDKNFISTIKNTTAQYQNYFYAAVEEEKKVGLFRNIDAGSAGLTGIFVDNVIELTKFVVETEDKGVMGKFVALRVAHNDYLKDKETKTPAQIIIANNELLEAVIHFKEASEKGLQLKEQLKNQLEDQLKEQPEAQVFAVMQSFDDLSYSQPNKQLAEQLREQVLAVMDSFENLNISFEKQQQLFTSTEKQRLTLQPLLKQLLSIKESYEAEDLKLAAQVEQQIFWVFMISIGLVLVTFLITAWILKRSILKPIEATQQTIQRVTAGETNVRSHLQQRDELGLLATALDTLLDEKVQTLIEQQAENEDLNDSVIDVIESVFKLSQRDLTVLVPVAEDLTGALADSINLLTESMRKVLFNVQSVAVQVKGASNNMHSQSEAVQSLVDQDQSEIKQTLDELNSAVQTMQRISELAKVSNNASLKAMDTSVTAQQSVSQTIDSINQIRDTIHQAEKKIKRLGERSQEIGGIVGLINNIAERTHLLSLNASMHAASAGEAGKSLMVVVDEVQRLAENSRDATAEISSLVNNIQLETADTINVINTVITNVVEGTKLAEQAGERMQETLETTEFLVESVDKISNDVLEQEKVAERLLNRANTLDESSKLTHKQMTQQTQLSDALVNAAEELQESVNVFKLAEVEA